jgi:hypothetical protein
MHQRTQLGSPKLLEEEEITKAGQTGSPKAESLRITPDVGRVDTTTKKLYGHGQNPLQHRKMINYSSFVVDLKGSMATESMSVSNEGPYQSMSVPNEGPYHQMYSNIFRSHNKCIINNNCSLSTHLHCKFFRVPITTIYIYLGTQ